MPYKLRKAPKRDLYWVIGQDGTKHSKEPLPKARAEAQMRALYAVWRKKEMHGGMIFPRGKGKKRGGAVSIEQRLAELNALIPSEQKWNDMKAKNPNNPMLKETYAQFVADRQELNRQRAQQAPTAEKEAQTAAVLDELKQQNEAYAQFVAENPEYERVVCNLNEKLERVKEYGVPAAICKARHDEEYRQRMAADPFGKVVQGLTDVADFAAENLVDFLPGIGQVAAEVYKNFAPPTSAFHSQNLLVGQGIPTHSCRPCGGKSVGTVHDVERREKKRRRAKLSVEHDRLLEQLQEEQEYLQNITDHREDVASFEMRYADTVERINEIVDKLYAIDSELASLGYLLGGGIFSDLYSKIKGVAKSAVEKVKGIVVKSKTQYSAPTQRVLDKVGNLPVVEMVVRRDPIRSPLHTVLNLVTLGKWNAARHQFPYDKVFHLGVEVAVMIDADSKTIGRYTIEKNERISVAPAAKYSADTETVRVPLEGSATINGLLENTRMRMGPNQYFDYDAFTNNCQDFVMALLTSNGLVTDTLTQFVKQPLDKVVQMLPGYTPTVAKAATTAAAVAQTAIGMGHGDQEFLKLAQRVAQRAGYDPKSLMLSDNPKKKLMIITPSGKKVHFGAKGHDDFLHLLLSGQKALADKKRRAYLARATKIKGEWRKDIYSPNSLAIHILWPPKYQ